jgi:hypothetical protein
MDPFSRLRTWILLSVSFCPSQCTIVIRAPTKSGSWHFLGTALLSEFWVESRHFLLPIRVEKIAGHSFVAQVNSSMPRRFRGMLPLASIVSETSFLISWTMRRDDEARPGLDHGCAMEGVAGAAAAQHATLPKEK